MKTSVVIVDDHLLIAKALKEIISKFVDFQVLYECENGFDLQEKILNKGVPKIVLLDISMPKMNGFETALWLTKQYPDTMIMALTMHDDDKSVIQMIKNGAKAYMLKNSSPVELHKALTGLVNNGFYYPEWASGIVYGSIHNSNATKSLTVNLTDKEKELLKHVTTELSYKEIAEIMCCSPRTVESYRDTLFEKLNLKSRVGLAVFAMKNNLF
jgi:DNA-binding NarL/FixJ family response regulator